MDTRLDSSEADFCMRICHSFSSVHSNNEPWWVEMVQLDPPNLNLAETPKVDLSCLDLTRKWRHCNAEQTSYHLLSILETGGDKNNAILSIRGTSTLIDVASNMNAK